MKKLIILILFILSFNSFSDESKKTPEQLRILAEEGSHEAMTELGYLYFTGNKVEKNLDKAVSLYRAAANKGNLWAMNNLCNMHLYGEGVEKDLPLAYQLCSEPARKGNSSSMVMLAEIVQEISKGSLANDKKQAEETAFKFYKMAATRGHAHGQYMLGLFFEEGKGVTTNINKAKEWYQKSAKKGHEGSIEALERLKKLSLTIKNITSALKTTH